MTTDKPLSSEHHVDIATGIVLSLVTCGLYHIYNEYKMGAELYGWLKSNGRECNPNLPAIGLVLSCFGLTIITDAVYQHEINKLC